MCTRAPDGVAAKYRRTLFLVINPFVALPNFLSISGAHEPPAPSSCIR